MPVAVPAMLKSWVPEMGSLSQHPIATRLKSSIPAYEPAVQYVVQLVHNKRLVRFVGAAFLFCFCLGIYYYDLTPRSRASTNTSAEDLLGDPSSRPLKYAFATLLSPNFIENADQNDIASDDYFLSMRVLNYQLRHSNKTKYPDPTVPFLIMTPDKVAQNKRDLIQSEGATIVPVEDLKTDWIKIPLPNWESVMSKLLLWSYTEYDRILFIDADVYLIESLRGIFDDDAAQEQQTRKENTEPADVGALPSTYVLGGIVDGGSGSRDNPMNVNYLNSGFFMIKPDMKLYKHFLKYLHTPDSFSVSMPEQNLINNVFKMEGPMPWQHLDPKWDTSCPEPVDIERGWKTIHSKLWKTHAEPCDVDPVAGRMWYRTLGNMETYYAGGMPL